MYRFCTNVALASLITLSLASCRSKVNTNPDALAPVKTSTAGAQSDVPAQIGERFDPAQEETVANSALKAWRLAISHHKQGTTAAADWKKARADDEKQSMTILQDLKERYPKNSTVQLMMGQVMHEFGKEKEAVEFYEEAIAKNSGSTMYVFKLAEAARTTGDTEKASKNYRKVLKSQPDFAAAQIGLAKCLLKDDAKSTEARDLINRVLDRDGANSDALEVKKQIQTAK